MSGSSQNTGQHRQLRIVVIDDEEHVLDLIAMLLQEWCPQATILKFQNRDDGWQELQRTTPDLLVTDMRNDNVPGRTAQFGITGFELLSRLAKIQVQYPVLAVSGCFSISGLEGMAKQCAANRLKIAYLTKPFTPELFLQALTKLLGSRHR